MNRSRLHAVSAVLALTAAISPQQSHADEHDEQDKQALSQSIHDFGMKLYDEVASTSRNSSLSPASVSMALAMALMGARGETASEMAKTLGLKAPTQRCRCLRGGEWTPERLQRALGALLKDLNSPAEKSGVQIVNDVWGQQGYGFLQGYADLLERSGASLREVDFAGSPDASRRAINAHVARKTHNRIMDLLPRGSVTPIVRQILTNAVYFRARWASEFWRGATEAREFTRLNGAAVQVDMMRQRDRFFYAESPDLQVLRMGYDDSRLQMFLLLPRAGRSLEVARRALDRGAMDEWMNRSRYREVIVSLPRVEFESSFSLSAALKEMGMDRAFDLSRCDFSGINGGVEPLPIADVAHKTFVKMDEEGTEAAAATAVLVCGSAIAEPEAPAIFQADRPFLFAIRDPASGLLLFVGHVVDPSPASTR